MGLHRLHVPFWQKLWSIKCEDINPIDLEKPSNLVKKDTYISVIYKSGRRPVYFNDIYSVILEMLIHPKYNAKWCRI